MPKYVVWQRRVSARIHIIIDDISAIATILLLGCCERAFETESMARLRSAPATQRSPLKEKTNVTRGARKAPAYENDGNTEGLVKERKGRSKTVAKAQNEDELVMAGGLGVASDAPPTTDELARSEGTLMTVKKPRRAVTRRAQSRTLQEAVRTGRPSGLPLEVSPPSSGKPNSAGKRTSLAQPGSALRSHDTPAVETSILALRNFKRRPRQPSMLAMVQQRTGVSSARPSFAPTAVNDDPSVYDFALEGSDDDDGLFTPEAEGTPVQAVKSARKPTRTRAATTEKDASSRPRKRKSDEANSPASPVISSDAKRPRPSAARSLLDDDALPTHPTTTRSSSDRRTTPPPQVTSDVQVANSPPSHPSSTPPTERSSPDKRPSDVIDEENVAVPSTKDQEQQQQQDKARAEDESAYDAPNGTMAEPASSSVPPTPASTPQISKKSVEPATQADPMTQISMSSRKRPTDKKAKPISTATLQSLLPKRRRAPKPRHQKSEYDFDVESDSGSTLDASHLEADQDELVGRHPRRAKQAVPSTKSRTRMAMNTTKAKASKADQPRNRKLVTEIATQTTKNPTRTYGRQAITSTISDKENEPYESFDDEDDTIELPTADPVYEGKTSAALQAAKDKFAEIDQWDMEFESLGEPRLPSLIVPRLRCREHHSRATSASCCIDALLPAGAVNGGEAAWSPEFFLVSAAQRSLVAAMRSAQRVDSPMAQRGSNGQTLRCLTLIAVATWFTSHMAVIWPACLRAVEEQGAGRQQCILWLASTHCTPQAHRPLLAALGLLYMYRRNVDCEQQLTLEKHNYSPKPRLLSPEENGHYLLCSLCSVHISI
ncbi:hypothetical protein Tdes44962_MAKER04908 [Teratosphaeria destructans]|uniref:Uncharacterized protein n=1 Tax=Teratosphaeria destructans TaxID=418781 RepID=A0A9W7SL60_9PEZI|nr:hypothetical protein Tdes44962_MAKER04908 [Teratosphaeria destructans]